MLKQGRSNMPGGNSTARPKNRDERKASEKVKDIKRLSDKLDRQYAKGEITKSARDKALKKLKPAMEKARKGGIAEPIGKEALRKLYKKNMLDTSGYNKGGMVKKANCGASMKPTQRKK
jgi:hypothetical protein